MIWFNHIHFRSCYVITIIIFNQLSLGSSSNIKKLEHKIVGGRPARIESYPSAVKIFNHGALCSGTIVNSWSVLTAAHCFECNSDVQYISLVVGTRYIYDSNGTNHEILYFLRHENYDRATFACDIALIFVKYPIKFGPKIQRALLANSNKWMTSNTSDFDVFGWGWTRYGGPISKLGLMTTRLRFVPVVECGRKHNLSITPDMFCLYGDGVRGACKGDSGGGVLWNGVIVGIVSHGDGCAKKNKPGIYVNVLYFHKWILKHVQEFFIKYCKVVQK